jgi:peptidoglycan/LPS O-acetylase OafA/YrhL
VTSVPTLPLIRRPRPATGNAAAPAPAASLSGSAGKILDIQALRGISILLVLLQHFSLVPTLLALTAWQIHMPFYMGVEIFFVISGYVITVSLRKDGYHPGRFVVRRLFRLMPAMLVFLTVSAALMLAIRCGASSGKRMDWLMETGFVVSWEAYCAQTAAVLAGYFTFVPPPVAYCYGAMWSLSIEDQFYWSLAVICLATGVLSRGRPQNVGRAVFAVAALVYAATLAVRIAACFGVLAQTPAPVPVPLLYLMAWRVDFLALGIMLALADLRFGNRVQTACARSGKFLAPLLLLGPLALAALCESPFEPHARWLNGLAMPVAGLAFGLLVLLAAHNLAFPAGRGPIYRALVYLGDRSYTWYLMHFPLLVVTWLCLRLLPPELRGSVIVSSVGQAVVGTLLLIPVCHWIYCRIELPMLRQGKRLTQTMGARAPQAAGETGGGATAPSAAGRREAA